MNFNKVSFALTNSIKIKQISNTEFQLTTSIIYPNKQAMILFIKKINNNWILTDKKQTLKQMNFIYDLNSKDTIKAIRKIITAYDFQMKNGVLLTEINENDLSQKVLEFLMCIGHLMNMYVFFELD